MMHFMYSAPPRSLLPDGVSPQVRVAGSPLLQETSAKRRHTQPVAENVVGAAVSSACYISLLGGWDINDKVLETEDVAQRKLMKMDVVTSEHGLHAAYLYALERMKADMEEAEAAVEIRGDVVGVTLAKAKAKVAKHTTMSHKVRWSCQIHVIPGTTGATPPWPL